MVIVLRNYNGQGKKPSLATRELFANISCVLEAIQCRIKTSIPIVKFQSDEKNVLTL